MGAYVYYVSYQIDIKIRRLIKFWHNRQLYVSVKSQEFIHPKRNEMSVQSYAYSRNVWLYKWLTTAHMLILMTLSVLADDFTYSSIH